MGGLGSGRRAQRLAARDCRALDLGELADAGRWHASPRGEVLWRSARSGALRARLTYAISGEEDGIEEDLILSYEYWPESGGPSCAAELELEVRPGRRLFAFCPACGARARLLYAPPGARSFRCRECCGLVYRRRRSGAADLDYVRETAGPALHALMALPSRTRRKARRLYVERPPKDLARELEEELPLAGAELRLWCLRLRAAGLSYRQIAALTGSSKSTAARLCRAGRSAIDAQSLIAERLERARTLPPLPGGEGAAALRADLRALHRHALRHRLPEYAGREREERVVMFDCVSS